MIDTSRTDAYLATLPAVQAPPVRPPKPLHETVVGNLGELQRAIADAKAGWRIVCKPGTYGGALFFGFQGKSGTPENPIQIAAQEPGRTIFEGKAGDVVVAQPWVHVSGIRFRKCRLVIRADHVGVHGNWFESHFGVYLNCNNGARKHYVIAYNSFTGYRARSGDTNRASQIYFQLPDTATALPENGRVFRNWFTVKKDKRNQAECHHFYIGNTYNPAKRKRGFIENLVLFHNLIGEPGKPSDHRRGFYWKWGGAMVENHSIMTRGSSLIRHGTNALIAGNTILGNENLALNGKGHVVVGNRWRAANCFQAMCQHLRFGKNKYQASDLALFAANEGDLALGYLLKGSSSAIRRTTGMRVLAHRGGKLVRMQETGTDVVGNMPEAELAKLCHGIAWRPVEIAKADVGPWALFGGGVRDPFPPELMDPDVLNDADEPDGDWRLPAPADFDPDLPEDDGGA